MAEIWDPIPFEAVYTMTEWMRVCQKLQEHPDGPYVISNLWFLAFRDGGCADYLRAIAEVIREQVDKQTTDLNGKAEARRAAGSKPAAVVRLAPEAPA